MKQEQQALGRKATYEINPLILNRWSARAMSGEALSHEELMPLFEAARWAPSAFNGQPWRFVYAKRDTPHWSRLFGLLMDLNKSWAKDAAALAVVVSKKTSDYNGQPNATHQFDTGAAWQNLALEATSRGLVAHAMGGFDHDGARHELDLPDDYEPLAMVAIGRPAPKEKLDPALREREYPSDRKPLAEIVMEGKFRA
ncbi:nitroreductase family protein [Candidatus Nitrososphaera evergladensis]|uniref:nitroreductase family protein n=1 Tax=Candidatus Nitrososphaera evergladensis TaxID=1459637 RepID=UPI001D055D7F|nr:nitroreductase family protein [Candidatus Nitrososphaera evergladensis]